MFDTDHIQEIWHALKRNKVRTLLTAFGVFWGIFMLIVMLGAGNGLRNGVTKEFGGQATNSFFVWTQATSKPYAGLPAGRWFRLDNADTQAIRSEIPDAKYVCPRNQLGGYRGANNVTRGSKAGAFDVMGDVPEIRSVERIRLVSGRFLNRMDVAERRKTAVVGRRVQQVLFEPGEDPVGKSLTIQGVHFKIVGVVESTLKGDEGDRKSQTIFIPFSTFQRAFNYGDRVGWYAVVSKDEVPASKVEAQVLSLLKQRHRVHPEDTRALGHWNMEKEYLRMQGFFLGIRTLIWIVGAGTLLAGVIGVSNIMLVIVRERTKEIGIRRAVGASQQSIMRQIILEAVILTALAGYVGLVAGVVITEGVAALLEITGAELEVFRYPGIDLGTALQALGLLVVSGVLAGIIPARRALSVRPVEALRME